MSQYSGKCDVYDCLGANTDEYLQSSAFFIGNTQLDIKSQRDLLPYYPFLIGVACYSGGRAEVHLSSKSFVDREEEEIMEFYMDLAKKEHRRCKRRKEPFVVEEVLKKISLNPTAVQTQIVERVRDVGQKATIDGLPSSVLASYYRKQLYDDMIKAGYDENFSRQWVFEKGNHHKN